MYPTNCTNNNTNPCEGWCLKPDENEIHKELHCFWMTFMAQNIKTAIENATVELEESFNQQIEDLKASIPDMSVINAFMGDIVIYDQCDNGTVFDCGAIILHDNKLLKSLIPNNDRHPDDTNSWEEIGTLTDILANLSDNDNMAMLKIPYLGSCTGNANCKTVYTEGECVAVKFDTGEVDSCGNVIYEDHFYVNEEDKNYVVPSPEAEGWNGPHTTCGLIKGGTIDTCEILNNLEVTE